MDALIAEKVMGWKFEKPRHGTCCTCQHCGRERDECGRSCEYSTDISAAWEVVEKMMNAGEAGWMFKIRMDKHDCQVEVSRYEREVYYSNALELPLAICRVVLKMVMG